MQLGKALRKEARAPMFRAGLRQQADGAELVSGDEAHKDALSFGGGDPVQQLFHPATAPRSGRIPVFESENVGPEPVDQFLNHAGSFRIIRPSGGPEPPVDEALRNFENRKAHAPAERIDCQLLA